MPPTSPSTGPDLGSRSGGVKLLFIELSNLPADLQAMKQAGRWAETLMRHPLNTSFTQLLPEQEKVL